MKTYNVIFKPRGKINVYKSDEDLNVDDYVLAETDLGLQFGKIESISNLKEDEVEGIIEQKATDEDFETYSDNLKDADKACKKCIELVKELDLQMNVINAIYAFDRSKLLFNFTADERIDFRELAKELASIYHTRIELRQIGARDRAREIDGIGVCGRRLCCANFLNKIEGISMNMAKDQNLALNPSKINGACGRLLCCLGYEDEAYIEMSKGMPTVGKKVKTPEGEAVVESVDILNRTYKVTIDGEKKEFSVDEDSKK